MMGARQKHRESRGVVGAHAPEERNICECMSLCTDQEAHVCIKVRKGLNHTHIVDIDPGTQSTLTAEHDKQQTKRSD